MDRRELRRGTVGAESELHGYSHLWQQCAMRFSANLAERPWTPMTSVMAESGRGLLMRAPVAKWPLSATACYSNNTNTDSDSCVYGCTSAKTKQRRMRSSKLV